MKPPRTTAHREESNTLNLEIKGRFSDKVQIAEVFQKAYAVFDKLTDPEIRQVNVVYHEDFKVEDFLIGEFSHAASEALAYKEAMCFGQPVQTEVVGLERIACERTRQMLEQVHRRR